MAANSEKTKEAILRATQNFIQASQLGSLTGDVFINVMDQIHKGEIARLNNELKLLDKELNELIATVLELENKNLELLKRIDKIDEELEAKQRQVEVYKEENMKLSAYYDLLIMDFISSREMISECKEELRLKSLDYRPSAERIRLF